MKSKSLLWLVFPKLFAVGCLVVICFAFPDFASAASNKYWDVNGNATGIGGTGTWDAGTTAAWSTSSSGGTPIVWNNANLDQAVFGGVPGTVTVSGTVVAGLNPSNAALSFNTTTGGAYTLSGGAITLGLLSSDANATLSAVSISGATNAATITINSPITLQVSNRKGAVDYEFSNLSAASLTLGSISLQDLSGGTSTGAKTYDFDQTNTSGSITINGSLGGAVPGTTTGLSFGNKGGVSGGSYYVNGDNSSLSAGAAVVQGAVFVGNANALGGSGVTASLGSNVATPTTAAVLTNGAITVATQFKAGAGSNTGPSHLIIGGATADDSGFSGGINLSTEGMDFTSVAGGRVVFSGAIGGTTLATSFVNKTGDGIVVFTSANTYKGGTTVTAGTLLLNNTTGSGSGQNGTFGTTPITVGVNGTLGGTGGGLTANTGLTTANGASSTFSPGDMTKAGVSAIGKLSLTGGISATSGATFKFDINAASSDLIALGAGPLTLGGDVSFIFTSLGVVDTMTPYSLFSGTGTWSGAPTFSFTAPTGYMLDRSYGGGNGYIWNTTGDSLTVQFETVPEPSTLALLFGAFGALFLVRRAHRKFQP